MSTAATYLDLAGRARRVGDAEGARRHVTAALESSRSPSSSLDRARALSFAGQLERDAGRLPEARALYQQALVISRELDDPPLLAHTLRHIADVLQDEGRLDLAEPYYLDAIAIYRSRSEIPALDLANAIRPFASLQEHLGRVNEARTLWVEARDLYRAAEVPEGISECSLRLAKGSQ